MKLKIAFTVAFVCVSFWLPMWAAALTGDAKSEIQVFESSTQTFARVQAVVGESEIFLPTSFLESNLGLVRKELGDEKVGICLRELCIPFSKSAGAQSLRYEGGSEYVPVKFLIESFQGNLVWDAERRELLLSLESGLADHADFKTDPTDFSLPNLKGERISLSEFRGKKVAVFAWASW